MALENHPACSLLPREQLAYRAKPETSEGSAGVAPPNHWHCTWRLANPVAFKFSARFGSRACVLTLTEYEAGRGHYKII